MRAASALAILCLAGCSNDITIVSDGHGVATRLVFVAGPPSAIAGGALLAPIRLAAVDSAGVTDKRFAGDVIISLRDNPTRTFLLGRDTARVVDGIATFEDLRVPAAGSGYTLTAITSGFAFVTSNRFDVVQSARLAFTGEPATFDAGVPIGPAVAVSVLDATGNPIASYSGPVTMSLAAGSPAGGSLTGTTTVDAVDGIATFSNLIVNPSGTGYMLRAGIRTFTPAISRPFASHDFVLLSGAD